MKKTESKSILPNFFWPSYSDLMTTLFFIMTLLYVISVIHLNKTKDEVEDKLHWVEQIQKSVDILQEKTDEDGKPYFEYDTKAKRFSLAQDIVFATGSSEICSCKCNEKDRIKDMKRCEDAEKKCKKIAMDERKCEKYLKGVGDSIQELIDKSKEKLKDKYGEVSYLVIVEGFASWDTNTKNRCKDRRSEDCRNARDENFLLSHKRARSLLSFWWNNGVKFDRNFTEFKVVGRGLGVNNDGKDDSIAEKSQRISISIMPKINYKEEKN